MNREIKRLSDCIAHYMAEVKHANKHLWRARLGLIGTPVVWLIAFSWLHANTDAPAILVVLTVASLALVSGWYDDCLFWARKKRNSETRLKGFAFRLENMLRK